MKKYVLLVSVFFLVLGLSSAHAANDTVVIGLQGPITGPWAYEGQMAKQYCEIAADQINQKCGILGGKKVVLKVEDDAGEPNSGALAARSSWRRRTWWQWSPLMGHRCASPPPISMKNSRR